MNYIDNGFGSISPSSFLNRKLIYKGSVALFDKVLCPNHFNLTYPIIYNMKNPKLQTELNEILRNFISNFVMNQLSISIDTANPTTLTGTYKLCLNENNLLSIVYEICYNVENDTNNISKLKSLTFNTSTGEVYSFKDLFKINTDYKEIITEIIRKQLKSKNIEMIKEFNEMINSENFYLTPTDLVIYSQIPYNTDYEYDSLFFEIPYKEIEYILNPALPIKIYFSYGLNDKNESKYNSTDMLNIALNLFKQAIDEMGASSPENAIELWSNGIKTRNGALQYSVLNKELKSRLEKCLRNTSWITGNSSPWVESYKIIDGKKIDSITYKSIVSFHLIGTNLDAGYVDAILTVEKRGKYWVIANIK